MSRAIPTTQPIGPKDNRQIKSKIKIVVEQPFILFRVLLKINNVI